MNFYKLIRIAYIKIVLLLYKFTIYSPPKLYNNNHSININNNDLNLTVFTLKTFNFTDFKTLLFNYNNSNIISAFHFLNNTPPCSLIIFNSDGELFGHYKFHIHKPDNKNAELNFDDFVISLMNDIFSKCVCETMKNKVSATNYKFFMHISNKNILLK